MGDANELRDQAITADIREMLGRDAKLADLEACIDIIVRGGVAHLLAPPLPADVVDDLRAVVGRVRGVHAVWLRSSSPGFRCLDIGCGGAKQVEASIGIDLAHAPAADILADLDRGLPFADASIDCVFAVHVLEHVRDVVALMNDLHRVLKPGGSLHLMVPFAQHVNAIADPTHVRFFHPQTFKHFCRPSPKQRTWYPELVSCDGASVFADLRPLPPGEAPPDEQLARFFD
ncbi:MAG: class I SAM-dependent methyltransferase [Dehalococcoidia bacterium]|nr:class I SAM-dependent methyltransferase [Dehalococcoidia bacterium]